MPQILKKRCKFTLRCLLDLEKTSCEQSLRLKTFGYFLFILAIFLSAVWLHHDHLWLLLKNHSHSPDVNHCVWAINFGPEVTWREWVSSPNWVPIVLWSQWHKPLSHSPQIAENNLPRLATRFYKMWKCPQYPKQFISWQRGCL